MKVVKGTDYARLAADKADLMRLYEKAWQRIMQCEAALKRIQAVQLHEGFAAEHALIYCQVTADECLNNRVPGVCDE
jgi:hypothetical protein